MFLRSHGTAEFENKGKKRKPGGYKLPKLTGGYWLQEQSEGLLGAGKCLSLRLEG